MTVQQLLDTLNEVYDKSQPVYYKGYDNFEHIGDVIEDTNCVYLL